MREEWILHAQKSTGISIKTRQVANSLMPGNSAYIESHRADGHNYGCSFIEFDGKGSFLGVDQFENSLKVLDTRKARSDVLLVIYCHGWMNNAQSGDVLHFVSFCAGWPIQVQSAHKICGSKGSILVGAVLSTYR
jgi:hypothetical protein